MGWFGGAAVFGLIGCLSLSHSASLPIIFHNNIINHNYNYNNNRVCLLTDSSHAGDVKSDAAAAAEQGLRPCQARKTFQGQWTIYIETRRSSRG